MSEHVIKLSATRVNTFLQCKQKYWFNYHLRLPKEDAPAFKLGIAVHSALEYAGNIWLENNSFTKKDIKDIRNVYNQASIKEGIDSLAISEEGWELVNKRLDNFAIGRKILGLEIGFGTKELSIETDEGVPLIGAIDKLIEVNDETILIVDYKTSKTAPTQDQLKTDIQLSIYDLVASKLWPDYKRRILCLDLLKSDLIYSYRTDEERANFSEYLFSVWESMKAFTEKDAKPSLNTFCGWCDYRDYCDAYKKARKATDYTFGSITEMTNENLLDEWNHISNTKKILEARERELKSAIVEKIKKFGEDIHTEDELLYVRQNARTSYDPIIASKYIPYDIFINLVSMNNKAVEEYVEANPILKDKIMEASNTSFTTPFIASKKLKKGKK